VAFRQVHYLKVTKQQEKCPFVRTATATR